MPVWLWLLSSRKPSDARDGWAAVVAWKAMLVMLGLLSSPEEVKTV